MTEMKNRQQTGWMDNFLYSADTKTDIYRLLEALPGIPKLFRYKFEIQIICQTILKP